MNPAIPELAKKYHKAPVEIAKQILNTAEKLANKKDVQSFRIDTHQANHFMRNLIRQHGFTLCGIVQVRDGRRMAYEINLQSRHNESCQA